MHTSTSLRWLVVAVSAAMLLAVAAACTETVEVPGETVFIEKEVIKEVQVPGETVVVKEEVVKTVEVPGETVVKEVVKTIEVPGETVVVEKEVVKTVEVPGQTVVQEVVKEVQVESDRFVRNVNGELVENPQYGGSVAVSTSWMNEQFDPFYGAGTDLSLHFVLEQMADMNWSLPPALRIRDIKHVVGELAESWEISPDFLTYTFHIRPDVHWDDKAPMNGRELTAHDFEYTWHRNLGFPEKYGFTEPGNFWWFSPVAAETVTATDDRTLVVKAHTAKVDTIERLLGLWQCAGCRVVPKEVIEEYGDMKEWQNVAGTGPFRIADVVPDSTVTLTKNPNYWQNDPSHPALKNPIPYIDELKVHKITDMALVLAGLRSGQLAMTPAEGFNLARSTSLMRTNPEMTVVKIRGRQAWTPVMIGTRDPFTDKNVRIAMQKAINVTEVNFAYYGGDGDPNPYGIIPPGGGEAIYTPYEEWPDEVKWSYEYDPDEAGKLLDEAGFPRGTDGVRFSVGWDACSACGHDIDLALLVTTYWDEIGVDVTVNQIADPTVFYASSREGTSSEIHSGYPRHSDKYLPGRVRRHAQEPWKNSWGTSNPEYDALEAEINETADPKEFNRIIKEMNLRYIEEMWSISLPVIPDYMLHQPWLKGYLGQCGGSPEWCTEILAFMWVDQELKGDMGH